MASQKKLLEAYEIIKKNYQMLNGADSRMEPNSNLIGVFKNCVVIIQCDDKGEMSIKQFMGKSYKYSKMEVEYFETDTKTE